MPLSTAHRRCTLPAVVACAALLTACGKKDEKPPPPPPPEVGYYVVKPKTVTLTNDLPGRTASFRVAEVRPQVSGVVQKRLFVEGANVKVGQPLYQIDPAPFRAALASAEASQARAEATLGSARLLAERYKPLADAKAVSRQEYDNAVASLGTAQADVASAKASVQTARINLEYTRVLSPISGRSGRSSVTEGALVTASQATALVTIQQLDPIYVDVVQPSTTLLSLKRQLASGRLKSAGPDQARISLTLEDGTPYPSIGVLRFSEVTVDPSTGAVTLRAEFPNASAILLPGMFVHLRLEEGVRENALSVPQQGVTRNPRGEAVALVVGPDSKVQSRVLKVDRAIGDEWLVNDGLAAGDKVIVRGLQAARPEAPVTPREVTKEELNKPAPPVAASGAASGAAGSASKAAS